MTPTEPLQTLRAMPRRHLAKAVSWRIVGTLDTLVLSFVLLTFLGPLIGLEPAPARERAETAGYIAATEVFTKMALYYGHEWLWAKLHWGEVKRGRRLVATTRRSAAKTFSWRALASLDTTVLALIFTGSAAMAVTIGGGEILTKLILYFIHERVWERIAYGLPGAHATPSDLSAEAPNR